LIVFWLSALGPGLGIALSVMLAPRLLTSDMRTVRNSNHRIRAGLQGAGIWAGVIAVALVLESVFNASGPEYAAPIPVFLTCAVLFGWCPALFVLLAKLKMGRP